MDFQRINCATQDGSSFNLEALYKLLPACFTEKDVMDANGIHQIEHVVDFEKLRSFLGKDNIADDGDEVYDFTWVGKRAARADAAAPINKTLRPCPEESVKWNTTKNLYIEGDNLEVLKLLQTSYMGKVKMIYIDPPYNTGKDFVYHDSFHISREDYEEESGIIDEEGNRYRKNLATNGRFHSDWCSMIYARLLVARSFLTDDGVIFISIDDNEVDNLRKIGNEVFGEANFIAEIIVDGTPKNDPYVVSTAHEYCLVFCKNLESIKLANYGVSNPAFKDLLEIYKQGGDDYSLIEENLKKYYDEHDLNGDNIANYHFADKSGVFRIGPIDDPQSSGPKDERLNPKTGRPCATPSRGWSCTRATWDSWIRDNLIWFPDTDDNLPAKKTYITEDRLDVMRAYFKMQTRKDTDALKRLFGTPYTPFSNPKPVELIRSFIENCNDKEMVIMDFFSGSGTTFHATLLQNNADEGHRKCILIQLPEKLEVTSTQSNKEKKITQTAIDFLESHNLPINICEIAKERCRRIGKQYDSSTSNNGGLFSQLDEPKLDIGFRVFKISDTLFEDVKKAPSEYSQDSLDLFLNNIKSDATDLDLLFGCMLQWGVELSLPLTSKEVAGCTVYDVNDGDLVACFADSMGNEVVDAIADHHPLRVVFRDSCFQDDAQKMNLIEQFKQRCGWSEEDAIKRIRVI